MMWMVALNNPELGQFEYQVYGVTEVLRARELAVPNYQRSYSWESSGEDSKRGSSQTRVDRLQVVEFWDDLSRSFETKTPYFLGTIVLTSGDRSSGGRDLIIDGQQRLATASILMAAIRDELSDRNDKRGSDATQVNYLGAYDRQTKTDLPRLKLNTDDHLFYESRIVNGSDAEPKTYSERLIASAYKLLRERISEFSIEAGRKWDEQLIALENWIRNRVQVVVIVVSTESDAYLIFETLNDRGADLTVADLLKNFLFSQAGDVRLAEVQDLWHRTLSNLGIGPVGNQTFTNFARHYLSSLRGLVRERDLFRTIKGEVTDPTSAVEFAKDLEQASRTYYAIMHSDSDYWSQFGTEAVRAAEVITELQIERYRPLILAVVAEFPPAEVGRFMVALVSWSVRMLAVGNLGGGVAEAAFCEAAVEVRSKTCTDVAGLLANKRIEPLVPGDSLFEVAFASWRTTAKIGRYLLRALELAARGDSEPELVVNDDVESVNLEHILPRNARDSDWPNIPPESRRVLFDRVGNMALLQKGKNNRIGNKSWAQKQPVLAASKLQLTNDASKPVDWDAGAIETRQCELAHLAVSCWGRLPT